MQFECSLWTLGGSAVHDCRFEPFAQRGEPSTAARPLGVEYGKNTVDDAVERFLQADREFYESTVREHEERIRDAFFRNEHHAVQQRRKGQAGAERLTEASS